MPCIGSHVNASLKHASCIVVTCNLYAKMSFDVHMGRSFSHGFDTQFICV